MKDVNIDEMVSLYLSGLTMKQVADQMGVATGTVYNRIKPIGVSRPARMGFLGKHHSDAAKEKIRLSLTGHKVSSETRQKISQARTLNRAGHRKVREDGYISVYYPSHPSASTDGYVMEHRLIMERPIGRELLPDEVVHHINHDRSDNDIENLALMSFKEHSALHMTERHAERRKQQLTL